MYVYLVGTANEQMSVNQTDGTSSWVYAREMLV